MMAGTDDGGGLRPDGGGAEPVSVPERALGLLDETRQRIATEADRLLGALLAVQLVAVAVAALAVAADPAAAAAAATAPGGWSAVLLGIAVVAVPAVLVCRRAGRPSTRYVVAAAQMLMSALLIHVVGGRLEMHLHAFGSLMLLAAYRDWRVVSVATGVLMIGHVLSWASGQPGGAQAMPWASPELLAWALAEGAFLVVFCANSAGDMRESALQQARLERALAIAGSGAASSSAELAARESLFQSIAMSSPVGVFRTASDAGAFDFANGRVEQITGLGPEMAVREGLWPAIHESDRSGVAERWRDAVSARKEFSQEFRVVHGDEPRWVHMRATPIDGGSGYVGTLEDITARKQAEHFEATLGKAVEELGSEFFIIDRRTGRFVHANRIARENTGYALAELGDLSLSDLQAGLSASDLEELISRLDRGADGVVAYECVHRRKDGSTYLADVRLIHILVDDERVLVAVAMDVSSRQAAEEERARFVTAIRQAPDAILILNEAKRIDFVNPAFVALTGIREDELMGGELEGVARVHAAEDVWSVVEADGVWTGCLANTRADGSSYEAEGTIAVVKNDDGATISYVAVLRDVTEQNDLQRQLGQAQKLEAIGQLAAGIAHEINTPTQYIGDNVRFLEDAFTALREPLELLHGALREAGGGEVPAAVLAEIAGKLEDSDPDFLIEEIPKSLEQALEGLERVTGIVHSMKEFSFTSPGIRPLEINRAIQSAVTVSRNEWKYLAEVDLELDPEAGLVSCEAGDVYQALLNLIINAAHAIEERYGPEGGQKGRIRISSRKVGERIVISVADDGAGIPDAVMERIFEPFFTTKEVGKGSGQGLNQVRKAVVGKHGGEVHVESEVGVGTTFVVELPIDAVGGEQGAEPGAADTQVTLGAMPESGAVR